MGACFLSRINVAQTPPPTIVQGANVRKRGCTVFLTSFSCCSHAAISCVGCESSRYTLNAFPYLARLGVQSRRAHTIGPKHQAELGGKTRRSVTPGVIVMGDTSSPFRFWCLCAFLAVAMCPKSSVSYGDSLIDGTCFSSSFSFSLHPVGLCTEGYGNRWVFLPLIFHFASLIPSSRLCCPHSSWN